MATPNTGFLKTHEHLKTRLLKSGVAVKFSFSADLQLAPFSRLLRREKTTNQTPQLYLVILLLFSAVVVTALWIWLHGHRWKEILHGVVPEVVTHGSKI